MLHKFELGHKTFVEQKVTLQLITEESLNGYIYIYKQKTGLIRIINLFPSCYGY